MRPAKAAKGRVPAAAAVSVRKLCRVCAADPTKVARKRAAMPQGVVVV